MFRAIEVGILYLLHTEAQPTLPQPLLGARPAKANGSHPGPRGWQGGGAVRAHYPLAVTLCDYNSCPFRFPSHSLLQGPMQIRADTETHMFVWGGPTRDGE